MSRLKADFHTHTSDDPWDRIDHSAEMLIDAAARKGFEVLAITCHATLVYDQYLAEYARRGGILLIPAMEAVIEGKHVVILNPDGEQARASTFEELRGLGRRDAVFVAPHPFFPSSKALGGKLAEHIDCFDAIEYSSFYVRGLNFNRRALRTARRYGLPMVGTSDTHVLPYAGNTFTWVGAEPTVGSVLDAIRSGGVEVETRPHGPGYAARVLRFSMRENVWRGLTRLRGEGAVS